MLKRLFTMLLFVVAVFGLTPIAQAQYMYLTSDNPTDNTRLRATGPTVITVRLDTNHDRGATPRTSSTTPQTCNSHTNALGCSPTTLNPLDMGSYVFVLTAVGGTVSWGSWTTAGTTLAGIYTDQSGGLVPPTNTQVEVNFARAAGFDTPGLYVLGSIPVTALSGNPSIDISNGPQAVCVTNTPPPERSTCSTPYNICSQARMVQRSPTRNWPRASISAKAPLLPPSSAFVGGRRNSCAKK